VLRLNIDSSPLHIGRVYRKTLLDFKMNLSHRWLEGGEDASTQDNRRTKMDIIAAVLSNFLLFLLIFGLSATVDMKSLRKQLKNKLALATGVAMQFIIMPLLGFIAVISLGKSGLTQAMGITLLVVTASPGGSYSNWWCSTFNADLALSVAMTAISTILSVGLLPANLFIYTYFAYGTGNGQSDAGKSVIQSVNFGALFLSLGVVICAVVSGLFASYKMSSRNFQRWANRGGTLAGVLLVISSIAVSSGSSGAKTNFWSQPWPFYVGVGAPCILGLILANTFAKTFRLEKPECVAISIECCYQNVGIATSVAITMFSDPTERAEAISVPLFYGLVEALVIGVYCIISWKRGWTKAPSNEKLCVVVSNTYEVVVSNDDDDVVGNRYVGRDANNSSDGNPSQNRNWFGTLFERKARREETEADPSDGDAEKGSDQCRCRLASEDVTVISSCTDRSRLASDDSQLSCVEVKVGGSMECIEEKSNEL